jgi:pyroglutamyl-peptidase
VKANAPRTLKSTIETKKLVTELRARGIPAQCSANAGRYLCNALLFASLYQSKKRAFPRQTVFIHIPPLNAGGVGKNTLLKAVKIAVNRCVSQHIHKSLMQEETGG